MKQSRTQILRKIYQAMSFSLALGFLIMVITSGFWTIHEFCPFALVCFGLSGDNFLHLGSVVMAEAIIFGLAVLIFSVFFGRGFCGWLCPFGTLQEGIYSLRGRKYCLKHRTPFYVDRKLAFLKYLILLGTVTLVILGLGYIYMQACPFFSLSQIPRLAIPGLVVLGIVVLKSFFGSREWCRFLCPYAASMNVFQWIGERFGVRRLMVKRNLERCIDCGLCVKNCPMNINLLESEYVHNRNCIHCNLCADKCPKPGTLCEEWNEKK